MPKFRILNIDYNESKKVFLKFKRLNTQKTCTNTWKYIIFN